MPSNEELSAHQTSVQAAIQAMQATIYLLRNTLEEKPSGSIPEDTVIYVTVSKRHNGRNPEDYSEAFKKYDFAEGNKGGYWVNIPSSKLVQLFKEYKGIDKELKFTVQLSTRRREK